MYIGFEVATPLLDFTLPRTIRCPTVAITCLTSVFEYLKAGEGSIYRKHQQKTLTVWLLS